MPITPADRRRALALGQPSNPTIQQVLAGHAATQSTLMAALLANDHLDPTVRSDLTANETVSVIEAILASGTATDEQLLTWAGDDRTSVRTAMAAYAPARPDLLDRLAATPTPALVAAADKAGNVDTVHGLAVRWWGPDGTAPPILAVADDRARAVLMRMLTDDVADRLHPDVADLLVCSPVRRAGGRPAGPKLSDARTLQVLARTVHRRHIPIDAREVVLMLRNLGLVLDRSSTDPFDRDLWLDAAAAVVADPTFPDTDAISSCTTFLQSAHADGVIGDVDEVATLVSMIDRAGSPRADAVLDRLTALNAWSAEVDVWRRTRTTDIDILRTLLACITNPDTQAWLVTTHRATLGGHDRHGEVWACLTPDAWAVVRDRAVSTREPIIINGVADLHTVTDEAMAKPGRRLCAAVAAALDLRQPSATTLRMLLEGTAPGATWGDALLLAEAVT